MGLLDDPTGAAAHDLAALGGLLVCPGCNDVRPLPNASDIKAYLDNGWPRCCGEGMMWVTAEQLGGSSTSPISERSLASLRARGLLPVPSPEAES